MSKLIHMGYSVVVPVCSSVSDEPGETKVNVEFQICKNGKPELKCYSLTLKEFQLFLRELNRTTDAALSAISETSTIRLIVILIPLAVGDPTDMVIEHGNNPKQSGVKMIVNKTMTMPNITFCMSKKQAWSYFKIDPKAPVKEWDQIVQDQLANMTDAASFLTAPWDYRLVMEAYEVIATLNSMERETTPQRAARSMTNFRVHPRLAGKRKLIRTWMSAIKKRNVTFTEFTQKAGYEMLRRSLQRFMRTSYDGNKIFKTDIKISKCSRIVST